MRRRPFARLAKRAIDVVGASVGLALAAPVLAACAVAIRLEDGGPVLFAQRRAGRFGRPFTMLKLRSMRVGAEADRDALLDHNEADAPAFKLRRDPRVTRVGRVLRRTSLDELPQLVHVLHGTMSLVGPRPPTEAEAGTYDATRWRRLAEKPGLTCTWQVSGRSELDGATWLAMDLAYVDGWTVSGDLALIARTVPAVLSGRGAW